jgi:hypothetical protein
MRIRIQQKVSTILFSIALFFSIFTQMASAEDASKSFGESSELAISGEVKEGDIIVLSGAKLDVSSSPYQNIIVGVMSPKPAYSAKPDTDLSSSGSGSTKYPVISSGVALTNVSLKNGEVKKGDFITSSSDRGVGMKAIKSGYVLGTALEDFKASNKDDKKLIKIALNIHYYNPGASVKTNITDIFKLAALAAYEQPKLALKYLASSLVVVITIIFSFISVGKIARLGIIALGRNPMASSKIYKGIFVNGLSSVAIIISGLAAAYFMIKI